MEDDFLIECIENEIESSNFDFKRDIYDFDIEESKEDFLIDVMSFANSHANGSKYIITGVKLNKDNSRKLRGINEQKIKDGADYQSLVNDNIEPNIIIDFKVIDYDGNKFGIFKIGSENNDKPYLLSKQYGKLQKGYTRIRKGQKNEYVSRRDFDIFYKEKNHDEYSSINLKGIINRNISDTFEIKNFENPVDLKKAQTIIENLYKQINDIKVIRSSKSTIKFGNELSIEQENIDTIQQYAKENNIFLTEDFFDIGYITFFSIPYSTTKYYGTESEKKKYKMICELSETISIFEGYKKFYGKISEIYYTELAIQNNGKKFDEDIEVTLKIKRGILFDLDNFPIPCESIIESVIDNEIIEKYLNIEKNYGINEYTSKYIKNIPVIPRGVNIPAIGYSKPSYDSYAEYFKEYLKSIIDYEFIVEAEYCFIRYEQKNIKPNEAISFPARILFNSELDEIEYEIKTKYNPNIQKGKIIKKLKE